MKTFDVSRLRELLDLDVSTGLLYWKKRNLNEFTCQRLQNSWNARLAGSEALAFVNACGHKLGSLDGRRVYAHRVVWALFYGEWPSNQIDHINHNPSDNRPENLRLASQSENCRNKSLYKANKTGVSGVRVRSGKWVARIKVEGKDRHLGTYLTIDEAILARMTAQKLSGYHQNHGC